jgi:hypothetical protein
VRRVRRQGRQRLHGALYRAYQHSGAKSATRIADELADIALAMFDGAFLAVQNYPDLDYEPLLMQMAEAVCALADTMVTSPSSLPRRSRTGS